MYTNNTLTVLLALNDGGMLVPLPKACKLAGLKYQTERNLRAQGRGRLPARKIGERYFANVRDVAAFIDGELSTPLAASPEPTPAPQLERRKPGRPRRSSKPGS